MLPSVNQVFSSFIYICIDLLRESSKMDHSFGLPKVYWANTSNEWLFWPLYHVDWLKLPKFVGRSMVGHPLFFFSLSRGIGTLRSYLNSDCHLELSDCKIGQRLDRVRSSRQLQRCRIPLLFVKSQPSTLVNCIEIQTDGDWSMIYRLKAFE